MPTFTPAPGFRTSKREHRIAVIDGPNMTNLGARNRRVYGAIASLNDLQNFCKDFGAALGVTVTTFASNYEGAILEFIHESAATADAYIINPAGLTEYGVATKHALTETSKPFVEVHFANIVAADRATRLADRSLEVGIQRQCHGRDDGPSAIQLLGRHSLVDDGA